MRKKLAYDVAEPKIGKSSPDLVGVPMKHYWWVFPYSIALLVIVTNAPMLEYLIAAICLIAMIFLLVDSVTKGTREKMRRP